MSNLEKEIPPSTQMEGPFVLDIGSPLANNISAIGVTRYIVGGAGNAGKRYQEARAEIRELTQSEDRPDNHDQLRTEVSRIFRDHNLVRVDF